MVEMMRPSRHDLSANFRSLNIESQADVQKLTTLTLICTKDLTVVFNSFGGRTLVAANFFFEICKMVPYYAMPTSAI